MLNKKWLLVPMLLIFLSTFSIINGYAFYSYTEQSGTDYFVSTEDHADALENQNEIRMILDAYGQLLGHSKYNTTYPADGDTSPGTLQIPETSLKFGNDPANGDIAAYVGGEMMWQTKEELGIDLSLYYLKTEIDTQEEMEAIWGVTLLNDITGESIGDLSDVDLTDLADGKILKYNSTTGKFECEVDEGGTGADTFTGLTDTPSDYTGSAGKFVKVNSTPDALEFASITESDISDLGTTTAMKSDKLSAFASTTSAELAGVISDETGSGKAVFNTAPTIKQRVTTVTSTHTMTIDEAGLVLVSASSDYTITLPTAVGNAGLTYHFKKIDNNYNCITLDANGTETINYENADGVPKETYARLNTYCAEVTIVSDGSNWQVISEALGQVPQGKVYLSTEQSDITNTTEIFVDVDTIDYDIGSNFSVGTWVSGTTTGTTANHVIDSNGNFTPDMVNHRIKNTTDSTYTYITAYNSATDITVRDDIFVSGEGYLVKNAKYIAPIAGVYSVKGFIKYKYSSVVVDKTYGVQTYKNTTRIVAANNTAPAALWITCFASGETTLAKNDNVFLKCFTDAGVNTVDIWGESPGDTWLQIRLISKD